MTNEQIIADIAATIYGEDAVSEMIENGDDIPLHTIKGWDEVGKCKGVKYKVRNGEHGIECRLWKKKNKDKEKIDGEKVLKHEFYLAKAYLFSKEQLEIEKYKE